MGRRELKRFRGTEQSRSVSPLPFGRTAAPGLRRHWLQLLPSPAVGPGVRRQRRLCCRDPCPHRPQAPGCGTSQPGYGCPCHRLGAAGWRGVLPFIRRCSGDQARATLLPVLPAGSGAWGNAALLPPLCPLQGGAVGQ